MRCALLGACASSGLAFACTGSEQASAYASGGQMMSGGSAGHPAGTGGTASAGSLGVGGSNVAGSASGGTGGTVSGGTNAGGANAGGANAGGTNASGASGGAAGSGGQGGANEVLGATPPMGWNSWNSFGCNLDEALIKQIADTFVSSGMQAAGYQYVNLDDCWMDGRDSNGKLRWNATKFPDGIPALAEYVHNKGLKLGIYEAANTTTCVGNNEIVSKTIAVGSLGHETTDAQTFASWGIDYLKYDKCFGPISDFATMSDALRATSRPIFYSINPDDGYGCRPDTCSIDLLKIANMWRIAFDITDNWSSVIGLIDQNAKLFSYAGPGHWNDPDMMEVGNGLTDTEGRAHFSMWAIMAAPLITGNDLRSMSTETKTTLTNTEVIAVDQDPLGKQGQVVETPDTDLQVWSKQMTGTNVRAVALLNRGDASASITAHWSALGIPAGMATVRDLWSHTDLGSFSDVYTATSVPSHGVVVLKVSSEQ